jgi:hypothetical protein
MGGLERPQSRAGLSGSRSFRPSASRVAERLLRRSAMGAHTHPSYDRRRLDGPAAAPPITWLAVGARVSRRVWGVEEVRAYQSRDHNRLPVRRTTASSSEPGSIASRLT